MCYMTSPHVPYDNQTGGEVSQKHCLPTAYCILLLTPQRSVFVMVVLQLEQPDLVGPAN